MGVAPTIPNLCSDELLTGCAEIAESLDVTLHTHLSETKPQCIFSQDRWGGTIVDRLADLQVLGPGFVGAHSVWLTDSDLTKLAGAGAKVAHLPASNLKLGSGIAPIRSMLDAGIVVGLGTDGSMSSDNQSMYEAMRTAANVSKILYPYDAARWLGSRPAWAMATAGSAATLGLADQIGQIAVGRKADIALFREDSLFLKPMSDLLNSLVYVEPGNAASTVIIAGRVVLDEGRIVCVDEASLRERAQEILDRARSSRQAEWELAETMAPYIESACRAVMTRPFPVYRFVGAPA
jgi:cytosine/adenosine deaminase-related metal-dependent hydrolase